MGEGVRHCPKCRQRIDDDEEYCHECKSKLPPPPSQPLLPISPEEAVSYAWGLSLSASGFEHKDLMVQDIKELIVNNRNRLAWRPATRISDKDLHYFDAVYAAIYSSFRSLITIIRGRNLNIDQAQDLMDVQIEKIENFDKLSINAGGFLPRVVTTGIGGTTPVFAIEFLGLTLPPSGILVMMVIGASMAYGFARLILMPWMKSNIQRTYMIHDYQRNEYYTEYVDRITQALILLYEEVLNLYKVVYKEDYSVKHKVDRDPREIVQEIIAEKGIISNRCPFVDKHIHYKGKKINWKQWASCETGKHIEYCPLYKKETTALNRFKYHIESLEREGKLTKKDAKYLTSSAPRIVEVLERK